jgi:hypothetical protein
MRVADDERLVEMKPEPQRRPVCLGCFQAEDAGDRITDHVAQHEGHQADDEQHQHRVERTVEQEWNHDGSTPAPPCNVTG